MAQPKFKIVAGASDWGSPLAEMPSFTTLEDAEGAAREYIAEQKRTGGLSTLGKIVIEETRQDGSVVTHSIA
jgi:hypothetical protein